MFCILCSSTTEVVNSRHRKKSNTTWRRRQCNGCNAVLTSIESYDLAAALDFEPANGPKKPFSRDILFLSVYEACKHRKTALGDATGLTDTILTHITQLKTYGLVSRPHLVEAVLTVLKRFDPVAATYYKAYHPPVRINCPSI